MGNFERMDNSKVNRRHMKLFTLASLGLLLDGYDLSVITLAMLLIPSELHLNEFQHLAVNASSFIGMIVGAPVLGWFADRFGRKKVFGLDLLFFAFFGIASGLSLNFLQLFSSRFLLGFGIGGDYPISSTLLSEISPARPRGKMLVSMVGMYWVGTLLSSAISYAFLNVSASYFWRYAFVLGGLLAVPIILLRLTIPESPRWLTANNRLAEAENAERAIVGASAPETMEATGRKESIWKIFSRKYARITAFVLIAWFVFDVAAYGLGFYYPTILSVLSFGGGHLKDVALSSMILDFGGIMGYVIAFPFADRAGRRAMTIAGFAIMFSLLLAGYLTSIKGTYLVIAFFSIFILFEQWVGAATLFYPTELYPTELRSSAQGISTAVSRVGAVLGIVLFPFYTIFSSLLLFSFFALIGLVVAIFLAPETKQKPLEKIVKEVTGR